MNSNEIYLQMAELWAEMSLEHSKPSKAAHGRARSAATKIKKLIGELLVLRRLDGSMLSQQFKNQKIVKSQL